jgi:hypothetical protein
MGWNLLWRDSFSTDTESAYTFDKSDATQVGINTTGGYLHGSGAGTSVSMTRASDTGAAKQRGTWKFHWTPGGGTNSLGGGPIIKRISAGGGHLYAFCSGAYNGTPTLGLAKFVAPASFTTLASTAITAKSQDLDYWLRATIDGNAVTVEFFTANPWYASSTAAHTLNHTLVGSDATNYGSGVTGSGGLLYVSVGGTSDGTSHHIFDVFFEEFETDVGARAESGAAVTVESTAGHDGFPGAARLANGNLITVYRSATDHVSLDGDLYKQTSSDNGASWSAASLVLSTANDLRDPCVSVASDGSVYVTYFESDDNVNFNTNDDPKVIKSTDNGATFGSPVAITHGFSNGCGCDCPAVEAANGDLIVAMHGDDSAGGAKYIRTSKSSDDGATWSAQATPQAAVTGWNFYEPFIVRLDTSALLMAIRTEEKTDQSVVLVQYAVYFSTSTDNGATWSTPTFGYYDLRSRPSLAQTSAGDVLLAHRGNALGATGKAYVRQSWDRGSTWQTALEIDDGQYEYGQWITSPLGLVYAKGNGSTTSDVYWQAFGDTADGFTLFPSAGRMFKGYG